MSHDISLVDTDADYERIRIRFGHWKTGLLVNLDRQSVFNRVEYDISVEADVCLKQLKALDPANVRVALRGFDLGQDVNWKASPLILDKVDKVFNTPENRKAWAAERIADLDTQVAAMSEELEALKDEFGGAA